MTQQELISFLEDHARKQSLSKLRGSLLTFLSRLIPFVTVFIISDHFLRFTPFFRWGFFLVFLTYSFIFMAQQIKQTQLKLNLLFVAREIEKAKPKLNSCLSHCLSSRQDKIISQLERQDLELPTTKISLTPLTFSLIALMA